MLEPSEIGNSTLPERFLRTPNQSLVFVVFFAIRPGADRALGCQRNVEVLTLN
jgi:hypothetical protein